MSNVMKIGIVTGGGDCPGLNAVIRAVAKTSAKRGWETLGIIGGYDGLLEPQAFRVLDYKALDGLLVRGGTILGTANRGQFSAKTGHGETRQLPKELLEATKRGMEKLGLSALVGRGRRRFLTIALQMHEYGIPIVGVPKTIDNDIGATTDHLRLRLRRGLRHRCARPAAHDRGKPQSRDGARDDGPLRGVDRHLRGVAGGADVILIPEIPFRYETICAAIADREKIGKHFTLVIAAEGARPADGDFITSGAQQQNREAQLGGVGAVVAAEIAKRTGKETRSLVLGHLQRGGSPTNMDRVLCTLFGAKAVELITEGSFGRMVAHTGKLMEACLWPRRSASCGRCRWRAASSPPPARWASASAIERNGFHQTGRAWRGSQFRKLHWRSSPRLYVFASATFTDGKTVRKDARPPG